MKARGLLAKAFPLLQKNVTPLKVNLNSHKIILLSWQIFDRNKIHKVLIPATTLYRGEIGRKSNNLYSLSYTVLIGPLNFLSPLDFDIFIN